MLMLVGVQLEVESRSLARIHAQVLGRLGVLTGISVNGSALLLPSTSTSGLVSVVAFAS